ncbi:hypothetical protein Suden_0232 [Sulfurimonas denitrificans DSM 1251]|uniref:Uncharacterized protein n=1 Tax=Sulfurimonas denitrificans (strain ATCC 33889 / DSM 1251) TaxID=326298 RepID=Q30U18_SULDN|nr:hypothetical protein [Sulfurimonas denitrificans]ABB43513.1 hypothetical protein Suden_0232 [Sulfurimonas denitrificans DSM 1251]
MRTPDYVVIMIGLFFIAESLSSAFASYKMRDCEDEKKIQELEEHVKRFEEKLNKDDNLG